MPIPFQCPHCGVHRNVPDQFGGQTGNCANCGQPILIPEVGTVAVKSGGSSAWVIVVVAIAAAGLFIVMFGGLLVALLLPAVQSARAAAQRMSSSNNMKQIGLAMLNYDATYRTLPAARISDPKTQMPPHSWRISILPSMGYDSLYDEYDITKPWDHPDNKRLESRMPDEFKNPRCDLPEFFTNYLAVVGEGTTMGDNSFCRLADIKDGAGNTILIVESTKAVHWMDPSDLEFDSMSFRINGSSEAVGLPSAQTDSNRIHDRPLVLLADGSVQSLEITDERELRSMLLRADGQ